MSLFGGLVLLGAFWGSAVALAGLNALYLCVSLIACVFILFDFRIGVVLLILLMPISRGDVFPHAMLGITGLNPVNLLLVATLGSCLLQGLFDGGIRRFMPGPLLWLYIVPFLIAGALGSRHVGEIGHYYEELMFNDAAGYIRELVVRPLVVVVFALLVGAAVARSEKLDKFLIPTLISIWLVGSMFVVPVFLTRGGLDALASKSHDVFTAVGLSPNDLGPLYAFTYALLLFTWAESKEPALRIVLLALMAMVVVGLMLTFCRAAYVGFIVVNALFLLWRRNAKTLIFLALVTAVALLLLPGAVYDRVTWGFGEGLNTISSGRIDLIWLPLLEDVLRSPIYGNGLGSIRWSEAVREGTAVATGQAHSAYLETVLDMGIAGLVLLCAYFVHVWKGFLALSVDPAVSPTQRGFYQGAAAGLACFLVTGITGGLLTPAEYQIFLWLAIGMMYGQRARKVDDVTISRQHVQAGIPTQAV
jgi:hypothetical protein